MDTWISTCELTKLAHIYKKEYTVKKPDECEVQSFQFAKFRVCLPQKVVTLNAIYQLPYSNKHPITNVTFVNEYSDKLSDLVVEDNRDSIILGDLNIHLNDEQSYDAETLKKIHRDTNNMLMFHPHS